MEERTFKEYVDELIRVHGIQFGVLFARGNPGFHLLPDIEQLRFNLVAKAHELFMVELERVSSKGVTGKSTVTLDKLRNLLKTEVEKTIRAVLTSNDPYAEIAKLYGVFVNYATSSSDVENRYSFKRNAYLFKGSDIKKVVEKIVKNIREGMNKAISAPLIEEGSPESSFKHLAAAVDELKYEELKAKVPANFALAEEIVKIDRVQLLSEKYKRLMILVYKKQAETSQAAGEQVLNEIKTGLLPVLEKLPYDDPNIQALQALARANERVTNYKGERKVANFFVAIGGALDPNDVVSSYQNFVKLLYEKQKEIYEEDHTGKFLRRGYSSELAKKVNASIKDIEQSAKTNPVLRGVLDDSDVQTAKNGASAEVSKHCNAIVWFFKWVLNIGNVQQKPARSPVASSAA